jgi:hypothetical protein
MASSTEIVISAASMITAVVALGIAVLEAHASRRHNRLSVRPLLRFDFRISPEFKSASISVINVGPGPAKILDFRLRVDGKTSKELGIESWTELTELLGAGQLLRYTYFQKSDVLQSGESHNLVAGPMTLWTAELSAKYRAAFRRFAFEIDYESLYGVLDTATVYGVDVYPHEPS